MNNGLSNHKWQSYKLQILWRKQVKNKLEFNLLNCLNMSNWHLTYNKIVFFRKNYPNYSKVTYQQAHFGRIRKNVLIGTLSRQQYYRAVLGLPLWNMMYNEVLNLSLPKKVKWPEDIEVYANGRACPSRQKTEMVLITNYGKRNTISIR